MISFKGESCRLCGSRRRLWLRRCGMCWLYVRSDNSRVAQRRQRIGKDKDWQIQGFILKKWMDGLETKREWKWRWVWRRWLWAARKEADEVLWRCMHFKRPLKKRYSCTSQTSNSKKAQQQRRRGQLLWIIRSEVTHHHSKKPEIWSSKARNYQTWAWGW